MLIGLHLLLMVAAPAAPRAVSAVPEPARAPAAGGKLAPTLRDGKPLCKAWQKGRCPEQHARNCAEGAFLCAFAQEWPCMR